MADNPALATIDGIDATVATLSANIDQILEERAAMACGTCARRRRYGALVAALCVDCDDAPFARATLDALDALAEIMIATRRINQWSADACELLAGVPES